MKPFQNYCICIDTLSAYEFGEQALKLLEKSPTATPTSGKAYYIFGATIAPLRHTAKQCMEYVKRSFKNCVDNGDMIYGSFSAAYICWLPVRLLQYEMNMLITCCRYYLVIHCST
jgi:hypothetical protein